MKNVTLISNIPLFISFVITAFVTLDSLAQTSMEGMTPNNFNYTSFGLDETTHPQKLNHYAPCTDCEEDLSARTLYNKKYIGTGKDKGLIHTQSGYSPINYQDKSGNWRTYDQRLKSAGNGVYIAADQFFPTKIDVRNGFSSITTQYGEVKFNNLPELIWVQEQVETSLGKAKMQNFTAGDDGVYVIDAWPGIDMEIRVLNGAIKTNYIVKAKPIQTAGHYIFRDNWILPEQISIKRNGEGILISNNSGVEILEVEPSFGYPLNDPSNRMHDYFTYAIEGSQVDLLVPLTILNRNGINFPYVIDPLVTTTGTLAQASILGSQYNASCNFTNSCNYTVNVPLTPSAIIENVTFSFTYLAQGICWLEDGAMRVQVGNCLSPNQAGFYWLCNGIFGGTCAANNLAIINDVQNCLPAPSCTPGTLPVTLQFFRRCYGTTGCSNTCIGASTPFIINVTSRTLEYTNPTSQITLSNTTICQGQSITASTAVTSGTAPIAYNWSLSPSGTPSVGTGATVTIPFPTAGTFTIYSTVTDACGNVINASRNVTVNPGPTISASSNPATICSGQSPNITLTSTSPSTTFSWTQTQVGVTGASNGTGASINQVLTNSGTANGSATYVVNATANGCAATPINVVVNVSPIPTGTATPNPSTICSGETTSIVLNSPQTGVTYTWTQSATGTTGSADGNGTSISQTLINAGTTTGSVTYTITPSIGTCLGTSFTSQVTVNPVDNATFAYPSNMICNTGTNPTPALTVPGTVGTFSGPGVDFVSTTSGQINLTTTPAGTYTITFTTSGPCPATSTQSITIINGPIASFSYTTPVCISGTNPIPILVPGATSGTFSAAPTGLLINATTGLINLAGSTAGTYTITNAIAASGGCAATSETSSITITALDNASFTYPSNSFCSTGTNPTPTITTSGTTGIFSGAGVDFVSPSTGQINLATTPAGTYTITFTTNGVCPTTSTQTITITNGSNASFSYTTPVCTNGTNPVPILATGATSGSFTSTPAGLSINTTSGIINLAASTPGSYTVTNTIASSGGCPAISQTATIVLTPIPTATISGGGSYCVGSTPPSITLNLTGSSPWNVGVSNGLITQNLTVTSSPNTFNPPIAGTYTLTSVSNGSCTGTVSGSVTIVQNSLPNVSAGNDTTACVSSSITLSGSGATTYAWSNGITNNMPFTQPAGIVTYTVTGTDANGCTNTDVVTVTTVPGPVVTLNTLNPVTCYGGNNGSILTSVTGGVAPIQYSWTGSPSTSTNAMNLTSGNYALTATDNSGCVGSLSFTVTQPDSITVTDSIIHYDCGISTGSILLTTSGGTPAYNYTWTPPISTSNEAVDLLNGNYQVVITDGNNCTKTVAYIIDNLNTPLFTFNSSTTTIDNGNSVTIELDTITGLSIDYISWSPSDSLSCTDCYNPIANPTETTWYYATIYLTEGCSYTDSIQITVNQPCPELYIPNIFSPNGDGENDFQCVRGGCITKLQFTIFDRWGEIVFHTNHQENCWDGTFRGRKVQTGVYAYKLIVLHEDGTEEVRSGNLTVIN